MRSYRVLFSTGIALAALTISFPASAASYLFQLSGSRDALFTIDTSVTPDFQSSSAFGNQVSYNNIAGSFGGLPGTASVGFGTGLFADLNIGNSALGFTQFSGPDLFSLANNVPVFNIGTFQLPSIVSGASTLTISSSAAAVPEPAAWAMFIAGFGLIGVTMRSKKVGVIFA